MSLLQYPAAAANAVVLLVVVLLMVARHPAHRRYPQGAVSHGEPREDASRSRFYVLAAFFALFVLFLYGPLVGDPDPVVPGAERRPDLPAERRVAALVRTTCSSSRRSAISAAASAARSALGLMVMVVTVVVSLLGRAGLPPEVLRARRRCSTWRSPAWSCRRSSSSSASAGVPAHRAASRPGTAPAFGAHLTWTLPFGVLIMFAVFNRFSPRLRGGGARPRRHVVADLPPCGAADDRAEPDRRRPVRLHAVL